MCLANVFRVVTVPVVIWRLSVARRVLTPIVKEFEVFVVPSMCESLGVTSHVQV